MTYSQVKEAIKQSDKDTVRDILDEFGEDILEAAIKCDVSLDSISKAYQGKHRSDADFAQQLLEDCGDLPKLSHYVYIDWERTANDLMADYSEYNGYYFRCL